MQSKAAGYQSLILHHDNTSAFKLVIYNARSAPPPHLLFNRMDLCDFHLFPEVKTEVEFRA